MAIRPKSFFPVGFPPTANLATAPSGAPWHAWPVVAASGGSIGHTGMIHAAKVLAAAMVDLYTDPQARQAIVEEFQQDTSGLTYRGYLAPGPPPVPTD